jgi:hypothetical protein
LELHRKFSVAPMMESENSWRKAFSLRGLEEGLFLAVVPLVVLGAGMHCTVRHGVWASDKILFAEKKTCRNRAKKPALNVRFAPESDRLLQRREVTLRAITDIVQLRPPASATEERGVSAAKLVKLEP